MDDKFGSLEGGRYSEDAREEERGEKSLKGDILQILLQ